MPKQSVLQLCKIIWRRDSIQNKTNQACLCWFINVMFMVKYTFWCTVGRCIVVDAMEGGILNSELSLLSVLFSRPLKHSSFNNASIMLFFISLLMNLWNRRKLSLFFSFYFLVLLLCHEFLSFWNMIITCSIHCLLWSTFMGLWWTGVSIRLSDFAEWWKRGLRILYTVLLVHDSMQKCNIFH